MRSSRETWHRTNSKKEIENSSLACHLKTWTIFFNNILPYPVIHFIIVSAVTVEIILSTLAFKIINLHIRLVYVNIRYTFAKESHYLEFNNGGVGMLIFSSKVTHSYSVSKLSFSWIGKECRTRFSPTNFHKLSGFTWQHTVAFIIPAA